jgi:chromosome segregation ATPase
MPAPYIHTPRTDASILSTHLERINEISPEKSFLVGPKDDLVAQMRKARGGGVSLATPRVGTRDPLRLIPNGNQPKGEFTPLMQSVTKKNMARRLSGRRSGGPETPAFLKNNYVSGGTPAFPKMDDISYIQSENTSSSAGHNDITPLPQVASSSPQSTPLAQLPSRNGGAVVNDGNMMTLREQESIIDKIEKENFGLKMKIHFLEDAMSKRGSDFNQAALKENTDLKVNRITMQRELHKFKKNIAQAERDAETYRLQLEEYRERVRRKQADETLRVELENLREELKSKTEELERLQDERDQVQSRNDSELRRLRDEIDDLQAELRAKDHEVEDRNDEIDALKMNASKESSASAELEDDLDSAKQEIENLRTELEKAQQEATDARGDREDALMEKRRAESDLEELQDEMANKSFTTKGLSRQLEEKAGKLEDDLEELREEHQSVKAELEEKSRSEKSLQERLRHTEKEGASDARSLQQALEVAQQQCDTFERKLSNMSKQSESFEKELQIKSDEKNLLQSRHDALTTESAQLQKDLAKARKSIQDLEGALEDERQRSAQQDNKLRAQHQQEADLLNEQIDNLHREINEKESKHATDVEDWEAKRRSLESARQRAEEKAAGLQGTIDTLQDSKDTLSGKETKLHAALEIEKERHLQAEKMLERQIQELNDDLASKRVTSDSNRGELNNAKEELRISIREQAVLKQKVSELEEEIEVLQADMDQEHELVEQLQKRSNESAGGQIVKLKKENQSLQESLANAQLEIQDARRDLEAAEADRDDLEGKLEKSHKSTDDTFNIDQEKRELRRIKQKLEKDLDRLKAERDGLASANQSLEDEINAEMERAAAEENRLNEELDQLCKKQASSADHRDRDLTSAKKKAARLEAKIKDLEDQLDNQSKAVGSPVDVSGLREDLAESRRKEAAATKRETELKSSHRDLKMQVNDLERELHEARLAQYKSTSKSPSPSPSQSKELAQARDDLVKTRAELRSAQSQVKTLQRAASKASVDEAENADLQEVVKTSAAEAEQLNAKLSEQKDVISDLRSELKQLQRSRRDTRLSDPDATDLSLRLSARSSEVSSMKRQLQRIRSERQIANEKACFVESELEILQSKYENMLEKLSSGRQDKDEIRQKEIRGLIKEITYLKGKVRREERLRKDLIWGKGWLEMREGMRMQWQVLSVPFCSHRS